MEVSTDRIMRLNKLYIACGTPNAVAKYINNLILYNRKARFEGMHVERGFLSFLN